ncbi:hypothetical protein BT69DRAFT_1367181 [Atractiella rhizophila]|nr:hypothetical protein BT69DRAFT_1367181 [Atractiella rhizophila]
MFQKGPKPSQEGGKASSGPGKGGEQQVEFASTSKRNPAAPQIQHSIGANKVGILKNSQRAVDESDGGGRENSTHLVDKSGSNWKSVPSHSIHGTPSFPRVADILGIDEETQNDPVQLLDFAFTEFRAMCRSNKLKNARGEFKTDQTVVDNISTLLKTCLFLLEQDPLSEMCRISRNQTITNRSIESILDRLEGIESKLAEGISIHDANTVHPTWVPDAKDFPPLSLLSSALTSKNAPTRSKAASKKAR